VIESPLINELLAESKHASILTILKARLGVVPSELAASLRTIYDLDKLDDLIACSAVCENLDNFQIQMRL
jgi:hypothetical protein